MGSNPIGGTVFDCSARCARSARIALWRPPTSSSLADEKRVGSILLSTAARTIRGLMARSAFHCSLRDAGLRAIRLKMANLAHYAVRHTRGPSGDEKRGSTRAWGASDAKAHSCFKAGRNGLRPAFQ
jgi:hypothetical protein